MGIFADLFKKKADANGKAVGNVEDFVSLTRVYFQCKSRYHQYPLPAGCSAIQTSV